MPSRLTPPAPARAIVRASVRKAGGAAVAAFSAPGLPFLPREVRLARDRPLADAPVQSPIVLHVLEGHVHPRIDGRNGNVLSTGDAWTLPSHARTWGLDPSPEDTRVLCVELTGADGVPEVAPVRAHATGRAEREGARIAVVSFREPTLACVGLRWEDVELAPGAVFVRPVEEGRAAFAAVLSGRATCGEGFDLDEGTGFLLRRADAVGFRAVVPTRLAFWTFPSPA